MFASEHVCLRVAERRLREVFPSFSAHPIRHVDLYFTVTRCIAYLLTRRRSCNDLAVRVDLAVR